jgi:hypothetical protein
MTAAQVGLDIQTISSDDDFVWKPSRDNKRIALHETAAGTIE